MSFSNDIKQLRKKSLLSQQDFADQLGVSYTTVNRWETGKTKPNYKTLTLINDYCKNHKIDFDVASKFLEDENK